MTWQKTTSAHHSHRAQPGRRRLPLRASSVRPAGVLVAALALVAGLALTTGTSQASQRQPTTTTAASSSPTKFGATVQPTGGQSYAQAFASSDQTFGGLRVYRTFYSGLPAPWPGNAGYGKRPVVVSFNALPKAVLSGQYDSQLTHWFATAPKGYPVYWVYYHEPENNIEHGQFNATDYRAAWQHLRTLQQRSGRMDLKSTLNLMCWTVGGSGRHLSDYYAGSSVIDVLAFDCYNAGRKQTTQKYEDPATLFHRAADAAAQLGKPFAVAEFGSPRIAGDSSGTGRAAWLRAVSNYLLSRHAVFGCYFNSRLGNSVDFRLTDRPSQQAWRAAVSG